MLWRNRFWRYWPGAARMVCLILSRQELAALVYLQLISAHHRAEIIPAGDRHLCDVYDEKSAETDSQPEMQPPRHFVAAQQVLAKGPDAKSNVTRKIMQALAVHRTRWIRQCPVAAAGLLASLPL